MRSSFSRIACNRETGKKNELGSVFFFHTESLKKIGHPSPVRSAPKLENSKAGCRDR
jgi:hypothetical protein